MELRYGRRYAYARYNDAHYYRHIIREATGWPCAGLVPPTLVGKNFVFRVGPKFLFSFFFLLLLVSLSLCLSSDNVQHDLLR